MLSSADFTAKSFVFVTLNSDKPNLYKDSIPNPYLLHTPLWTNHLDFLK